MKSHLASLETDALSVDERVRRFLSRLFHDAAEGGAGDLHLRGRLFVTQTDHICQSEGFQLVESELDLDRVAVGHDLRNEARSRRLEINPSGFQGSRHFLLISFKVLSICS
jgi:hypothetical protein